MPIDFPSRTFQFFIAQLFFYSFLPNFFCRDSDFLSLLPENSVHLPSILVHPAACLLLLFMLFVSLPAPPLLLPHGGKNLRAFGFLVSCCCWGEFAHAYCPFDS
jgi:hypothetical protein